MAITGDAASVLEDFIQDGMLSSFISSLVGMLTITIGANLPGEIVHLYQEMGAKDQAQEKYRHDNASREAKIQKFIKLNGARKVNPDEEAHCTAIRANFAAMEVLQDEQVALSEKICLLVSPLSLPDFCFCQSYNYTYLLPYLRSLFVSSLHPFYHLFPPPLL